MKQYLPIGIILVALGYMAYMLLGGSSVGGTFERVGDTTQVYASSTAYAISWGTATRLVATSTRTDADAARPATVGRTGLTMEADCASNGEVWLQFSDIAAATATGFRLNDDAIVNFGQDVPMVHGSINGLVSTADCTVHVTEWRAIR